MTSLLSLFLRSDLFKFLLSALLGGAIGAERGRSGQAAGMRTHILVALGATLTTVSGLYAADLLALGSDPLRLSAQVISGIGFLGVGTILVRDHHVTGLTTAAGLWSTAAVGIALGIGYYEAALAVTALIWVVNTLLAAPKKRSEKRSEDARLYAELTDAGKVNAFIDLTHSFTLPGSLAVVPCRSGIASNVGLELELTQESLPGRELLCASLLKEEYVAFLL